MCPKAEKLWASGFKFTSLHPTTLHQDRECLRHVTTRRHGDGGVLLSVSLSETHLL